MSRPKYRTGALVPMTEDEERILRRAQYWRQMEINLLHAPDEEKKAICDDLRKKAFGKLRDALDHEERERKKSQKQLVPP